MRLLILSFFLFGLMLSAGAQCLAPSNVSISNITATGAVFSWIEFGSSTAWDISVVAPGEPAGTTPTAAGLTSTSFTYAAGLPGEVYCVYVRSDCGGGNVTGYAGPICFQVTPAECVTHIVYDPPLVIEQDAATLCDSESQDIDLNGDGINDLFVIAIDQCEDLFYYFTTASSVRVNQLGIEDMQFVTTFGLVNDTEGETPNSSSRNLTPMNLGSVILTTEWSPEPLIADHSNEYSQWDGAGVRYIGFDLYIDGFAYNGWIKAEVSDASITIYETSCNNRINDPMIVGQTDCVYCPADFNEDGFVEINDFLAINSAFGSTCSGCPEDITGDGVVDVNDFIDFNSAFGLDCSTLFQNEDERSSSLIEMIDAMPELEIHEGLEKVLDDLRNHRELILFPNPTSGEQIGFVLDTQIKDEVMATVRVNDLSGKLIWTDQISIGEMKSSREFSFGKNLESGFYLLGIETDGKKIAQRFVVE